MRRARKLTKKSVNYRESTNEQYCGNCAMFNPYTMFHSGAKPDEGSCDLVRGAIRPQDTCDRWVAKES